jgi:hypothetical protein
VVRAELVTPGHAAKLALGLKVNAQNAPLKTSALSVILFANLLIVLNPPIACEQEPAMPAMFGVTMEMCP